MARSWAAVAACVATVLLACAGCQARTLLSHEKLFWLETAPSPGAAPLDCAAMRAAAEAQHGCMTIWELLLCPPPGATESFQKIAEAALHPGVGLARVLQQRGVALSLLATVDSYYERFRREPGVPRPGQSGGNTFNPVIAQFMFYYSLLPGAYSPSDLLTPATRPVKTSQWPTFATLLATSSLKLPSMSDAFLALRFENENGSGALMEVMEAMSYPSSTRQSALVTAAYEACNGWLYATSHELSRVLEVGPAGSVVPGTGGSFPDGFKLPMTTSATLMYQPECNGTSIDEWLYVATALSAEPSDSEHVWAAADMYLTFATEPAGDIAEGASPEAGRSVMAEGSFTLLGLYNVELGEEMRTGPDAERLLVSWLLYMMLPGAHCPDELVASGSSNTLLGMLTNSWQPLMFNRSEGGAYAGQVTVTTPEGLVVGQVTTTYTACRNVMLSMTRQLSVQVGYGEYDEEGVPVWPDALADVTRAQPARPPVLLPWDKMPTEPSDVWDLVSEATRHLRATPGACERPLPSVDDFPDLPPRPSEPPAPAPAPAPLPPPPPPTPPGADVNLLAIIVPSVAAALLFLTGACVGGCLAYRRHARRQQQAAAAAAAKGYAGGSLGGGAGDNGRPVIKLSANVPASDLEKAGSVDDSARACSEEDGGGGGSGDGGGGGGVDKSGSSGSADLRVGSTAVPLTPRLSDGGGGGGVELALRGPQASLASALEQVEHSWVMDASSLQLLRKIGAGSFGEVYCGRWNSTTVAAKKLPGDMTGSPEDVKRFVSGVKALQKEVAIIAGLRHPNVVLFLGVCLDPPCLVTEYCERGSLFDVICGMGNRASSAPGSGRTPSVSAALDWRRRLGMAQDAATGLEFLHSRGIVHSDVKSPNLLVDRSWHVKVADFGLSKLLDSTKSRGSLLVMNPKWLAPEVIRSDAHSFASDVFSFGVVLWELLVLEEPYEELNPIQVAFAVANSALRPPVPADLDALPGGSFGGIGGYVELMQACWAQEPSQRPTFEEVVARLRELRRAASCSSRASSLARDGSGIGDEALRCAAAFTP